MDLKQKLKELQSKVEGLKENIANEEATKKRFCHVVYSPAWL